MPYSQKNDPCQCGQHYDTAIYEGHNPEIGGFLVNISEDDRYTMTVEGKRAKGNISFQILRNEE